MSEWNVMHENFHTKQRAHSARWTHAIHHSVTYYERTVSILWANEAAEQFIWLVSEKKTEAINAYVIKNSKGEGEGVGRKAVGRTGRNCMGV